MIVLTQDQAAEIAGLTARRMRQLDKDGDGPERTDGGEYPAEAFGRWMRNRVLADVGIANDGESYDYNAERARLTKNQADKTELEVAELRGNLIRVQAVTGHWQNKVSGVRAKLLALPSKLASQVAPPDKIMEAQDRAQALVYEALAELSGDGIPDDVRERTAAITRSGDRSDIQSAAATDNRAVGGTESGVEPRGQRRAR